ncbi:MAG: HD domain-containing protein [Leptospiraceae bacterium]|nr:HD domain-containing protein [Leptospiraceae bacterium]
MREKFAKIAGKSIQSPARLVCRQFTHIVDSEMILKYQQLDDKDFFQERFCVIAVGGYGRMELAPFSDIDILYLYEDIPNDRLNYLVSYFNNFLYNQGKEVGYACRTLSETKQYLDNVETFYSILDSRFLLGSEELYSRFEKEILMNLPEDLLKEFNELKMQSLQKIIDSEPTLHNSEPNLKNGHFGLRDIQIIYWLEKSSQKIPSLSGLAVVPIFTHGEVQFLENAYDFYLKVRTALHIINNRKVDTLAITLQAEVAEFLGFGDTTNITGIDKLMRTLYSHEMEVYLFVATYLDYKKIQNKKLSPLDTTIPLEVYDGFLYPAKLKSLFSNPDTLYSDIVKVFQIAVERDLEISPILLNEVRFAANFLNENFVNSFEAIDSFMQILKSGKEIGKVLTKMHHSSVLGKLFPEFGACTNFPLFSYHHQFTVDEHSLLILREMDKLQSRKFEDEYVQNQFDLCENREILALAILIHDAGKVKPGDHCQYGAELAVAIGERLRLSDEDIGLLKFLVEWHILMSELSTKQDTSNTEVLKNFSETVGDVSRLRLLYILTIIDTKSVGKAVLTNWKKAILKSLFEKSLEILSNNDSNYSQKEKDLVRIEEYLLKEGLSPGQAQSVSEFASKMIPNNYIKHFTPRRILQHFLTNHSNKSMKGGKLQIEIEKEPAFVTLTVSHKEEQFFLSDLTGCVSALGLNVISLRMFRVPKGLTLYTVQITDMSGSGDIPSNRLEVLQKNILNIALKKITVDELLRNPGGVWFVYNKIPRGMVEEKIEFNNTISPEYTVLQIQLPDSLGLLYRITKAILSFEIDLHFVRISTSADFAFDSFYFLDKQNQKVIDTQVLESMKERIVHAIQEKAQANFQTY